MNFEYQVGDQFKDMTHVGKRKRTLQITHVLDGGSIKAGEVELLGQERAPLYFYPMFQINIDRDMIQWVYRQTEPQTLLDDSDDGIVIFAEPKAADAELGV